MSKIIFHCFGGSSVYLAGGCDGASDVVFAACWASLKWPSKRRDGRDDFGWLPLCSNGKVLLLLLRILLFILSR